MKICVASDHAGFELKEKLREFLVKQDFEVKDFGTFSYNEADDYPDFIKPLAEEVSKNPDEVKGIVIGGSGQGEAMVANRFKAVRAAVLYNFNKDIIKLSRQHNDANILSLGARFLGEKEAKKIVKFWLETEFSGEKRHVRRIAKID